jgi:hypothetical protein
VIIYSAFASQPPVVEAHIKVDWMTDSVSVENHDGITVGDVMDKICEWSVNFYTLVFVQHPAISKHMSVTEAD